MQCHRWPCEMACHTLSRHLNEVLMLTAHETCIPVECCLSSLLLPSLNGFATITGHWLWIFHIGTSSVRFKGKMLSAMGFRFHSNGAVDTPNRKSSYRPYVTLQPQRKPNGPSDHCALLCVCVHLCVCVSKRLNRTQIMSFDRSGFVPLATDDCAIVQIFNVIANTANLCPLTCDIIY